MNLREIKELGLNQVFKKKKKTNFNQQTKVSVRVIKNNSISLLEFMFDLNLMRSFFLKILLKLFRIKIKIF